MPELRRQETVPKKVAKVLGAEQRSETSAHIQWTLNKPIQPNPRNIN